MGGLGTWTPGSSGEQFGTVIPNVCSEETTLPKANQIGPRRMWVWQCLDEQTPKDEGNEERQGQLWQVGASSKDVQA